MKTAQAAIVGLKWASLAKIAGQGITWAITLVVIRVLDPGDYGVVAVAAVFVNLLGTVAELGLGTALVQARTLGDEETGRVAAAALVLNLACMTLIVLTAPLLGKMYGDAIIGSIAAVTSLTLLFGAISVVPESLLYREMQFRRLALVEVLTAAIGGFTTLGFALAGWGAWSLAFGTVAMSVVRCLVLLKLSRWVRPRFSLRGIGSHLRFGGTLTASRFAWQGAHQCDILIGGYFLSEVSLGLYSVSVHLARMPMSKVMNVINQVALPAVARSQDDRGWLATRLVDAIALLGLFTVPLLWGLSSVAPEFVSVVLGEEWSGAALPLQLIALMIPAQLLSNVFSTTLAGLGRADVDLRNMLVTLLITVALVLAGATAGLPGLAIGLGAAGLVNLVVNFPRTNRVLGLSIGDALRAIRGPFVAGACMYGAVYGTRLMLKDFPDGGRLVALVVVGAIVYLLVVLLLDSRSRILLRRTAQTMRGNP